MQVNIAKTYACKKATSISKPVNATEKLSGNHPPNKPKLITKLPKTFNMVWPAIMFANNLTERLTGLLKYEIISIMVIKGNNTIGTPFGTNIDRYLKPCFMNPIIVTAININNAITSVTIMWLVTVKE